jgi:DNA polymerase
VQGDNPEPDVSEARRQLARELRQHLESLQRAGVRNLPIADWVQPIAASEPPAEESTKPAATGNESSKQTPQPEPASPPQFPPASPPPPAPPVRPPSFGAGSLFDEPGFDTDPVPPLARAAMLHVLAEEVAACQKCPNLAANRTQTVFADGSPTADLIFIGEAPGADEDRTGVPFVGRAGQLLTDMITKGMGMKRESVYIANIIKCRPPENRDPTGEEAANCLPYLEKQIETIRPRFICLLGRIAAQHILGTTLSMGRLRQKWHRYRGIPTLVTYHPAYLLRNPAAKKDSWEDLQLLMNAMGLPIPSRRTSTS